jgi:hypothetical protein
VIDTRSALAAVPEAELVIAGGPAADGLAEDPEAQRKVLAERFGWLTCG